MAAEAARALRYPKIRRRLPPGFVPEEWIEDLAVAAVLVADGPGPGICRDPADEIYLAAAVAAGAGFLVTGDDDLLALREHGGVAVVAPRRFLEILAAGGG
jgi:putative PIN family toxin of toxin-antitoxin system